MAKEIIGELEFTPGGIANFLEGKIIESDNYKGLFKDVKGSYGRELKTFNFEFSLVVAKKDDVLVIPHETSKKGNKQVNRSNVLASHTHHITIVKQNLEDTCAMFVNKIENIGKGQEELNEKLDKQFSIRIY